MTASPQACERCLRRAWLVGELAPYIEKIATGKVGERSPELLALSDSELAEAVAPNEAGRVLEQNRGLDPAELSALVAEAELWACCRHDRRYPPGLADARDAPVALFGRGDPALLERLLPEGSVTVVGARRAGSYGLDTARMLARELAAAGMLVVSGMAFGVDAAAHRGALDRGPTVAVLGCGADVSYPATHRRLHAEIGVAGLVLSELPPGATPWRWTFPARNRIMAALAGMTVVVEAAARSGSLITAEQALGLNRDVGAVPGPVSSKLSEGTNQLLAEGASVVRGAQDVLDLMLGVGVRRIEATGDPLSAEQEALLEVIERGCEDRDSIALLLGQPVAEVAQSLAKLELLGYVCATIDGRHVRTAQGRPAPI